MRARARRLDFHQRDEAVHFWFLRHQLGEDAAEAQRVVAQARAHPVVAGRRRIAFVVDEVDHREHRRDAVGQLVAARHFERHLRVGERALGAHDALRDRRLGYEECACDLVGRQAAEQAQGQRDARLGREHRMTRGEDESQQVVADRIVERFVIGIARLAVYLEFVAELLELAFRQLGAAQTIDRAMLRGRHEPGARIVRHAGFRPLFERGDERVLREFFGEADIAHETREAGNQAGRFDTPDGVDRAMGVVGSHSHRSEHQRSRRASERVACNG
jgi:hypothetical protein